MSRWTLPDGIEIRLASLLQSDTYHGLIEGLPTREMNARTIASLLEKHPGAQVLAAVETPIELDRKYPFGIPASLPAVCCVASLRGPGHTNAYLYRADLTIIWFQESWAFPIDEKVRLKIEELDWSLAVEWEI